MFRSKIFKLISICAINLFTSFFGFTSFFEDLPLETKYNIFKHLELPEILKCGMASRSLYSDTQTDILWKNIARSTNMYFFTDQEKISSSQYNLKEEVVRHYLNVFVNTSEDLETIYRLTHDYTLHSYKDDILSDLFVQILHNFGLSFEDKFILCALGKHMDIISISKEERDVFPQKGEEATILNDWLANQGDEEAIDRKIEDAIYDWHGYTYQQRSFIHTRTLIEYYVEKGSISAIFYLIDGCHMGYAGYTGNCQRRKNLLEGLVSLGNTRALLYKAVSLKNGTNGYQKNFNKARRIGEQLISLNCRESDSARRLLNMEVNPLIYRENQKKIELEKSKLPSKLSSSTYSNVDIIENLEKDLKPLGFYLKALGFKYGLFGFEKDRDKAYAYIRTHGIPY